MNSVLSLGIILESCFVINLQMPYSNLINLMWSVGKLEFLFFIINNSPSPYVAGDCLNRSDRTLVNAKVRDLTQFHK